MSGDKMDLLSQLPLEIVEMILQYLSPDDVINCLKVSKRWRQLTNNDRVWSKQLPYYKYMEESWQTLVAESHDETENCRLMRTYLFECRIKKNLRQGNYNVITSVPHGTKDKYTMLDGNEVWSTDGGLLLSNGDRLKIKPPLKIITSYFPMKLSWDLRLLAAPFENFVHIYEREPPAVEFDWLALLAVVTPPGEDPGKSMDLSIVSCPKFDKESVDLFMEEYYSPDSLVQVNFLTGVESPDGRHACLQLCPINSFQNLYVLWDIDGNRLVHKWEMGIPRFIMEGWDRRGVCLMYAKDIVGENRIEFYDLHMQQLTVIPLMDHFVSNLVVSCNFAVAAISKTDCLPQLVMWEKDSTEYRVLLDECSGRIASVNSSTIACCTLSDYSTVAILAAPNWEVVAVVEFGLPFYFHVTEFSNGSLFVVTRSKLGYIWHDIDRRKKTEEIMWSIKSGQKFKLPKGSDIKFIRGVKLAILTETHPGAHLFSVIDYDKPESAM